MTKIWIVLIIMWFLGSCNPCGRRNAEANDIYQECKQRDPEKVHDLYMTCIVSRYKSSKHRCEIAATTAFCPDLLP